MSHEIKLKELPTNSVHCDRHFSASLIDRRHSQINVRKEIDIVLFPI
ncbi:hypothetical protein Agau_P200116 (plasmid) [Agrobacterium tumefaciens F2]|nr:hypothetical protein Agau_P200116 [Agrobacterium tumefaciens F2]